MSLIRSPFILPAIISLLLWPSMTWSQWYAPIPASRGAAWQQGDLGRSQERETIPAARAVSYDHVELSDILQTAPMEWDEGTRTGRTLDQSTCRLTLPLPVDGIMGWEAHTFRVVRSDVMAPELAARYPEIQSFMVQSETDGLIFGRIDVSPRGFHGILHTAGGTVYIDPWNVGSFDQLMVYTRAEFMSATGKRRDDCDVRTMGIGKGGNADGDLGLDDGRITQRIGPPYGQTRRDYSLALACTGEYGQFHGGTVSSVLSAMNTSINRINSIVEPELAIRLNLIPDNDDLIFLNGSTDPLSLIHI